LNVGDNATGSPVMAGTPLKPTNTTETGSPVAATKASFKPLQ
jgi:hypothetical protein